MDRPCADKLGVGDCRGGASSARCEHGWRWVGDAYCNLLPDFLSPLFGQIHPDSCVVFSDIAVAPSKFRHFPGCAGFRGTSSRVGRIRTNFGRNQHPFAGNRPQCGRLRKGRSCRSLIMFDLSRAKFGRFVWSTYGRSRTKFANSVDPGQPVICGAPQPRSKWADLGRSRPHSAKKRPMFFAAARRSAPKESAACVFCHISGTVEYMDAHTRCITTSTKKGVPPFGATVAKKQIRCMAC